MWPGAISLKSPGVEAAKLVIEAGAGPRHAEAGGHGEEEEEEVGHGGHDWD